MTLHGIGASSGIGIGRAVCIQEQDLDYSAVVSAGKEKEKARLQKAIEAFQARTQSMADDIKARVGEKESEILTGQIMMLNDPFMLSQMNDSIDAGNCAEAAVDAVCSLYAGMFAGVDDELMRQRATDVRDIRTRMLGILLGRTGADVSALPPGTVLVAHDLTPSMTVGLKKENIAGILTGTGGKTSHSAILARALELPAVLSVDLGRVRDGDRVILDGDSGEAILSPDEQTLEAYRAKRTEQLKQRELLEAYRGKPTVDADGNAYQLYANIGSLADAEAAAASSAEGIGLFRTEFLFMDRPALPSEEEQYEVYRQVSSLMQGKEVIIRTLDIGGDKDIAYLSMDKEENPFLGHRAIRYCLDRPDLFRVQLRALLRAGAQHRNIKVMLPLVTSVDEVRAAKVLLSECKAELEAEGKAYDGQIALGVMMETPAAALTADLFAQEADFFSIGTNDLTQYVLAVDRGNAKVEKLYTPLHPAVLRSIQNIITAAKTAGIPVGMCGEAAADPCLIPLLLSFGLDEFSVSPSAVLATRRHISTWHKEAAGHVAAEAMSLSGSAGIGGYLKAASSGH